MYNYLKADLYLVNLMLDHVQLVEKTVGRQIDTDYMIHLEHIAYHLSEISDKTKQILPEMNWACLSRLRDLINYEVYHFKLGDVIETVSDEMLVLSELLPKLRDCLEQELEGARK
ncbi:hypothetical protein [Pseudolactococcus reticulitermitis]|uniref:DUF86 domain-containing protein n=1 Tax=Pseudolactococcus reticulitermitis TaxID=2025039 RepID=A0A224XE55_9LACT|nr:hypothetical protein [Lactococcus reticulitermitis]GAX47861.1 hypothetical protein RsY01_1465 [Lactococcus reticulitermitis]